MCEIDNNTDFRDLLVESLTQNGSLAKIRAELRAQVYLTLDNEFDLKIEPKKIFCENDYVALLFLIHDFLNDFGFEYTLSVFEAESDYIKNSQFNNRDDFFENFYAANGTECKNTPALLQVFQIFKNTLTKSNKVSKCDVTYELPADSKSYPQSLKGGNDSNEPVTNIIPVENAAFLAHEILNENECELEISEEIHTSSADDLCNETKINQDKMSVQKSFNLETNISDLIQFKDTSLKQINSPKNVKTNVKNILEETLIMSVQSNGKSTEIASSSPLNNADISINLMKFDDSFGDLSAVKTSEMTGNESDNTDRDKSMKQIQNAGHYKHQPEKISTNSSRISHKNQSDNFLKCDVPNNSQNVHTFCDSPTKNICKQKLDNIQSTSLPSFYVNISNIEGFELDMDSLDNYEEDILSLSTDHTSHGNRILEQPLNVCEALGTINTPDRVSDKCLFTVSGIDVANPETLSIGDGPMSDIEKTNVEETTKHTFKS